MVLTGLAMLDARDDPDAAAAWLERATAAAEPDRKSGRNRRHPSRCAAGSRVAPAGTSRPRAGSVLAAERYATIDDDRFTMSSRSELAHSLRRAGASTQADAEYRQTILGWQRTGNRGAVANQLESLAFTAIARGSRHEGGPAVRCRRGAPRSVRRPDDRR